LQENMYMTARSSAVQLKHHTLGNDAYQMHDKHLYVQLNIFLRQTSHCAKDARGLAHTELMLFQLFAEKQNKSFMPKKAESHALRWHTNESCSRLNHLLVH
jgi:hypothetical protein